EVRGGEHTLARIADRVASRLQLLEVRDFPNIHLGGQVPARGRAEPLAGEQQAARQCPRPLARRPVAAPPQHVQALLADLERDPERLVAETSGRHTLMVGRARTCRLEGLPRVRGSGRLVRTRSRCRNHRVTWPSQCVSFRSRVENRVFSTYSRKL